MNAIDRERMIGEVKQIRSDFYDRAHRFSHGLGALFQENFRAAISVLYGDGNEWMRTGHRASEYAADFSADMGMKPEEWAGWIIEQNKQVVQRVYAVERQYLRLVYRDVSSLTDRKVNEFRRFCEET